MRSQFISLAKSPSTVEEWLLSLGKLRSGKNYLFSKPGLPPDEFVSVFSSVTWKTWSKKGNSVDITVSLRNGTQHSRLSVSLDGRALPQMGASSE